MLFLDEKLLNLTVSFVVLLCSTICPRVRNHKQLERFVRNLKYVTFYNFVDNTVPF